MNKLDIKNFEHNNFEHVLSVKDVLAYIQDKYNPDYARLFYHSCNCGSRDFEIHRFYYSHDDASFSFYDDMKEAIQGYGGIKDAKIYEVQVYSCLKCQQWNIDYLEI